MLLLAYRSRGYIFLIGVEDGCSTRGGSSERKKERGKKRQREVSQPTAYHQLLVQVMFAASASEKCFFSLSS
jgi:hypothetical protein